jgi:lipopolysaccharide heptosyltransferase III
VQGERGNRRLRLLDRYVGIPVVALSGAVRRRRSVPAAPRRIGVMNSTTIGDTVLLSAVLRDVAAAFPDAEVILFAGPSNLAIARLIEGISARPIRLTDPRRAIGAVRAAELDVVLDFDQWPRIEPVYCLFSGAKFRAGFRSPGQHRHYAYDAVVDHSAERHELDNYRALARVLGVDSRSKPSFSPPGRIAVSELPESPYVVFHLWPTGYRSELKEWPGDNWRALAEELTRRDFRVMLTGSPQDRPATEDFLASCNGFRGNVVNGAGAYDLEEVVDVLAGSSCVVSVNTGVMHLAAAAGAPTISLNGPTSERRWGPVGPRAVSVNSELEGCGFLHFGWEYAGQREDCMQGISVERVLHAVEQAVAA